MQEVQCVLQGGGIHMHQESAIDKHLELRDIVSNDHWMYFIQLRGIQL